VPRGSLRAIFGLSSSEVITTKTFHRQDVMTKPPAKLPVQQHCGIFTERHKTLLIPFCDSEIGVSKRVADSSSVWLRGHHGDRFHGYSDLRIKNEVYRPRSYVAKRLAEHHRFQTGDPLCLDQKKLGLLR